MTNPTDDEANGDSQPREHDRGSDEARTAEDRSTEPTVEIPGSERELRKLRDERDQLEQQLQRSMADTANIRRRQKQEMDDSRRRVLEGLTQELLPVLDGFSLALQAYDQDDRTHDDKEGTRSHVQALVDGVRMVQTLLTGALERHGLQEIPAEGRPFDPSRHEAVSVQPHADIAENHVVRVLQTGYMLGEHVVRHSKVIVAGPAANDDRKGES